MLSVKAKDNTREILCDGFSWIKEGNRIGTQCFFLLHIMQDKDARKGGKTGRMGVTRWEEWSGWEGGKEGMGGKGRKGREGKKVERLTIW